MDIFFEILKITIPSLIVLFTGIYLVRPYLVKTVPEKPVPAVAETQKFSFPLQLQAYERLVLLVERLQPASLILRMNLPGMTASDLHAGLLQMIREEVDHNLSQQLYVSGEAWIQVRSVREEVIKLINTASSQLAKEATAADLAERILILSIEKGDTIGDNALDFLKNEARERFF